MCEDAEVGVVTFSVEIVGTVWVVCGMGRRWSRTARTAMPTTSTPKSSPKSAFCRRWVWMGSEVISEAEEGRIAPRRAVCAERQAGTHS